MRVAFHTLGCKVNQYETEAVKEAFVSRGAKIVPEDEPADVYVVNTCTVTNIADRKSRQYIRRMKALSPDALMVVTGCYAQTSPNEVDEMPEVDLVIGNSLKSEIADKAFALYELRRNKACECIDFRKQVRYGEEEAQETPCMTERSVSLKSPMSHVLDYGCLTEYEDMGIVTSDESSMCRAYIKIEEGCDRFCSYCLIPYARGRVRSRAPKDVVNEARVLIEKGYKEIILTGINTALYGTEPEFKFDRKSDEEGLSGLETIIKRIDALEGDFRIRLSSLEPTVVDVNDVKSLLGYDKLCHHLHLSVQSGSDKILKAMNRRYGRDGYLGIVKALRDFDPLYGITTDIIVGFPGEEDDDFRKSLDVVKSSEFARVHAFRYSPRRGTAGAGIRKGVVPGNVSSERAEELEKTAFEVAREFNEKNLGKLHRVLTEEESDGFITGYTDNYIRVYIDINKPEDGAAASIKDVAAPRLGEFCIVKLTENYKDGCRAVTVSADAEGGCL